MNGTGLPLGINVIISVIAAILYLVVLISIPFRIKKNGKRTISSDGDSGDSSENIESGIEGNKKMFWLREIAIFLMSAVIIVLCAFISFGTVGNVVLCGCGVMGSIITARELSGKKETSGSSSSSSVD